MSENKVGGRRIMLPQRTDLTDHYAIVPGHCSHHVKIELLVLGRNTGVLEIPQAVENYPAQKQDVNCGMNGWLSHRVLEQSALLERAARSASGFNSIRNPSIEVAQRLPLV